MLIKLSVSPVFVQVTSDKFHVDQVESETRKHIMYYLFGTQEYVDM